MSAHDVRGPSSLGRLVLCPGSANLIEAHPEIQDTKSEASERGDKLHACMAKLPFGTYAVLTEAESLGVDKADLDDLCYAVEAVKGIYGEYAPDFMECEIEVDLSMLGISSGTADVVFVKPFESALVLDYKFGRYPVPPPCQNKQLAAYAVGIAARYAVPVVDVCIVQPALGFVGRHTYTDLEAARCLVKSIIDQSKDPAAPRIPNQDACRFCRVSGICPEAGGNVREIVSLAPVEALSLSELEAALDRAAVAKAVIGRLEEAMYAHLVMGGQSSKWELSKPSQRRQWKEDLAGLEGVLPAEAWERNLRSPAQVEKLVGKEKYKEVERFIVKKGTKPSLVPVKQGRKEKENGDHVQEEGHAQEA